MIPILETERLQLVPFATGDTTLLHDTFTHPFVRKYLWDDQTIPEATTEEILQTNQQHFAGKGWGLWKIMVKSNQEYAGFTGLWFFFTEPQPQLLYGLLPEHSRKGYATEAAAAIIRYAFDVLGFDYLIASFDKPNQASEKVCERLRMQRVQEKLILGNPVVFYRIDRTAAANR